MSKKKLVPLVGQTGLDSFINTTPKGRSNYCHSALGVKKRTPPSPENRTQKKKSCINQVGPIDEEDIMENPQDKEPKIPTGIKEVTKLENEKDPSHEGNGTVKGVYNTSLSK